MSLVVFYEKPGCNGNARQKALLEQAGHTLDVRNLLRTPWTRETLLPFLAPLPVSAWFNRNAPAVKRGTIDPDAITNPEAALALLLEQPLLIRRPLLEVAGETRVGFDPAAIDAWIGLPGVAPQGNLEVCAHGPAPETRCADTD